MTNIRHAIVTLVILVGTGTSDAVFADDEAKSAPQRLASLSAILDASGITANGFIAASYYGSTGYPVNIHQFDVNHNSFQIDQAGLTLAYQPKEGVGALVEVIAGEDARILHAAEDGQNNTIDLKQGFVQYVTGPITVIAGKFVTLAGAEVIAPTGNSNFSRSLLFFDSQPLTHTGLRSIYAVNDTLTLIGGINNGWNTTSTSYGSKTGEAGISWAPNKMWAIAAQAYLGRALPYDARKTLVDVVATYNATSTLTLIVNVDFNQQRGAFDANTVAKWGGVAGYANYAFNDRWRVSIRGERLDDHDGFLTGHKQQVWEGTVTFGYSPVKSFELRLEARHDKAKLESFYNTTPALAALVPDAVSLTGVALQGVYKF